MHLWMKLYSLVSYWVMNPKRCVIKFEAESKRLYIFSPIGICHGSGISPKDGIWGIWVLVLLKEIQSNQIIADVI